MSAGTQWRRLDPRMIWVDAAQTLLSLSPVALAVGVFGVEPGSGDWCRSWWWQ